MLSNGQSLSTVTLRLKNPDEFCEVICRLRGRQPAAIFRAQAREKFFEEQSEMMATFHPHPGDLHHGYFQHGCDDRRDDLSYGAVANRTVEIGTLRASGFYRRSILLAFLLESLFLSLGGGFGRPRDRVAAAIFHDLDAQLGDSFSELAFSSLCRRRSSRSRWDSHC